METLDENVDDNNETPECERFVEIVLDHGSQVHLDQRKAFRHRFLHTFCIFLSLLALGWRNSMLGPTFPDLRLIMNEDLSTASWIFTAKSLGGLVGSLCGGLAYDRFNKIGVLTSLITCMGVFAGIVPWCNTLTTMFVVHAAHGLCGAGLDTAVTADAVLVWRHEAGPYMQAIHGAFSIGAILSPLICEPFLTRTVDNVSINVTSYNLSSTHQETNANSSYESRNLNKTENIHRDNITNISVPYLITMGLCFFVSFSFLLPRLKYGSVYKKAVVTESKSQTDISGKTRVYFLNYRMKVVFTMLLAVTISLYTISEYCFAGFLMTFLITELKWSKKNGSNATSTFWLAFALGRLTGIFVVKCCRLTLVLLTFFSFCILGAILFWLSVRYDLSTLTWVSMAVIGFGMSVIFPSIFSWLSENIRSLTGKMCSILFFSICIGTMSVPRLVGYLMDKQSQWWFIYSMLLLSVAMLCLFIFILVLFQILERRHKSSQPTIKDKLSNT